MLHIILYIVQVLIIAACFIYSLRLWFKDVDPAYMKFFLLYPLLGCITSVLCAFAIFSECWNYDVIYAINNVSKLFHFFILSTIIYRIQKPRIFSVAQIIVIVAGWVYFFFILFSEGIFTENFNSQFAANFPLVILALFYFRSLLSNVSIGNLRKDPGFWIVVGVVLGQGVSLPLFATIKQLFKIINHEHAQLFLDFGVISFSVMYLSFIKAIQCTRIISVG